MVDLLLLTTCVEIKRLRPSSRRGHGANVASVLETPPSSRRSYGENIASTARLIATQLTTSAFGLGTGFFGGGRGGRSAPGA